MGFGTGRSTNDTWVTVAHARHFKTTIQYHNDILISPSHNPYDIFNHEEFKNHHEIILPNGEIVFSTFTSLDDLLTSLTHMLPHTKLISLVKNNYARSDAIEKTITMQNPINMSHTCCPQVIETKHTKHDQLDLTDHKKFDRLHNMDKRFLVKPPTSSCGPKPLNISSNKDLKSNPPQFFRTLSERNKPTSNMSIQSTIQSYLHELDIDNVHPDLARSLCKRIGALSFVPFSAWLQYETMEVAEMREHLKLFVGKNKRDIEDSVDHKELLSYEDISGAQDKFKPETLAITQADAIRQTIIDGYNDMKISFDPKSLENQPRHELICSFYNALIDFTKTNSEITYLDLSTSYSTDSSDIDLPVHSNPPPVPPATKLPNTITPLKRPHPGTPERDNREIVPMDTTGLPIDYTQDLLKLTFVQIELLERNEMLPYLVFLGQKFKRPFRSGYFHNTSTREIREDLITYIMELHSHYSPSLITEATDSDYVDSLEPFLAYNEYFIAFPHKNYSFTDLLLLPIQHVKQELIKHKILKPRSLEESFQPPITQSDTNPSRNDLIGINIQPNDMLALTNNDIFTMDSPSIISYLTMFANLHDRILDTNFAQFTQLQEQREVLFFNSVELHTKHTSPALTSNTTDAIIASWDRVHLYFEYFMFYHENKPYDSLVFSTLDEAKIRDDVILARDSLSMQSDSVAVDQNNSIDINNNGTVSSANIQDVHMFYEVDNIITCEEQQELELMFENTCQYHRDNQQLSAEDRDADILSLLGLIHSTDVPKLLDTALHLFVTTLQ